MDPVGSLQLALRLNGPEGLEQLGRLDFANGLIAEPVVETVLEPADDLAAVAASRRLLALAREASG